MAQTPAQTMVAIRIMGMAARYEDGEYRINYPRGTEATAYYTDDAKDALQTARQMATARLFGGA
ncbi:MAG: hypothetical protein ACYC0F_18105 [Rhodanobacter sp.]